MKIDELQTPAILIYLDSVEHNLKNMIHWRSRMGNKYGQWLKRTKALNWPKCRKNLVVPDFSAGIWMKPKHW